MRGLIRFLFKRKIGIEIIKGAAQGRGLAPSLFLFRYSYLILNMAILAKKNFNEIKRHGCHYPV